MMLRISASVLVVMLLALSSRATGQTPYTWTGGTGALSLWGTSTNWSPAASSTGPGSNPDTANNDIAIFAAAGTSTTIQLNFGTIGTTRYLGTIQQTGGVNRTIGSNTATAGSLILNGTGANNLIIDNQAVQSLTFAPQAGGGSGPMTLQLVQSNSTISNIAGTSSTNTGFVTISANITQGASAAGLTKTGSGILILSGTNTFAGATTISNGFVQYNNAVSLYNNTPASWTTSNIVVQSGAVAVFRVGGTGAFTSGDFDTLKNLGDGTGGFLAGSGIGIDTTNANLTYSSDISNTNGGADAIGFHKFGTNALTLTGNNTYTGGTFLRQATLNVAGAQSGLPANGDITIGNPSGVTSTVTLNIGTTSQTSPSTYSLGAITIAPAVGVGTNVMAVNGNSSPNTTTVNANGAFFLQRGTVNILANSTWNQSGPMTLLSADGAGAATSNATFNVNSGALVNYTGLTAISLSAQQTGGSTGFLGSRLNINAGTLTLENNINQDANFTANSTGNAQVTFQNAATLRLNRSVNTLLTSTLVELLPTMMFGTGVGGIAGNLDTNNFSTTISTPITSLAASPGAINVMGGGTLTINSNNTHTGGVTLATGTTLNLNNGGAAAPASQTVTYASGAFSLTLSNVTGIVLGQRITLTGFGAGTFIRTIDSGTNVITLSQSSSSAGTSQTLAFTARSSLGTGTFTIQGGTIDNTSGSPVVIATNNVQSWAGDFTFGGTNELDLGTGAITMTASRIVNTLGSVLTLGGAIGDGGNNYSLTKNGPGILRTTANHTFTGGTTIDDGTMQIESGSLALGTVAVNGGTTTAGTLRGAGTIAGTVIVNGGTLPGTIRPGNSVGTLTIANGLTITTNGRLTFELLNSLSPLDGAANSGASTTGTVPSTTSNSFLDITGSLIPSSGSTIAVIGTGVTFDTSKSYSFQVGRVTGSPAAFAIGNLSQFEFVDFSTPPVSASFEGLATGEVYLNFSFVPIPEPSILLLGVFGLFLRRSLTFIRE